MRVVFDDIHDGYHAIDIALGSRGVYIVARNGQYHALALDIAQELFLLYS